MFERFRKSNRSRDSHPESKTKNAIKTFAFFAFVLCLVFTPIVAFAQVDLGLEQAAEIGLTTTDIRTIVARIINAFFGLLGLIIVILFLYGGFLWMTSQGDAGKIQQAKQVMINATIGLIIILSAYAIAFFIIRAVTGESILPGGIGGRRPPPSGFGAFRSGSSGELGNGIIEYHYPEVGQTDVPRNTKISITFKKSFLPSTVFADYTDNGTYILTDDMVGGVSLVDHLALPDPDNRLSLNTDNFKIILTDDLGDVDGTTPDERFNSRYPDSLVATARVTDVQVDFDPLEGQTIVMTPTDLLGSASADLSYRVAIRGGDNGVLVWTSDPETGEPVSEPAFDAMNADGGYFWPFMTGTELDLTSPQITYVGPRPENPPSAEKIYRNELLQIYFDEAIDPTTASGIIGVGGGFTNIEIKAKCLVADECGDFNDTFGSVHRTIEGTIYIGNKYRTAEFIPSAPCEGVRENSCGEPVYCLPPNVEIRVRTRASTLSVEPPAGRDDGVQDMVGNSLDGNDNGTAEGPPTVDWPESERSEDYYRNDPQADLTDVSDTARWLYYVGTDIDLVPPVIIGIDPVSHDVEAGETGEAPDGPLPPELYPVDRPVTAIWSKVMSVTSMRTGAYQGGDYVFTDDRTTIAMRALEKLKADFNQDCTIPDVSCAVAEPPLDPPWFQINVGDGPVRIDGFYRTVMQIEHRILFTANDLGYTEEETAILLDRIPIYAPVIGAKTRDTRQNCFYPSIGFQCADTDDPGLSSCCDRESLEPFGGTITCD
ncbi:MAG: pilin [Patescibacteria group bacterium]|nr:pilin [Patescibacteria group bacterium]